MSLQSSHDPSACQFRFNLFLSKALDADNTEHDTTSRWMRFLRKELDRLFDSATGRTTPSNF